MQRPAKIPSVNGAISEWRGTTLEERNTTSDKVLVTVVMPCLNEEGSVGGCIDEAVLALEATGIKHEILVVDNNSTDRSVEIALAHGARVIHEGSPGYGSALRSGIEAAFGDIVVMADADLTYDLSRIAELVAPVIEGSADIVLGERLSEAPKSTMPFLHRHVGTPVLTLLVRRATHGLTVTDSQSGYRAFRRDAVLGLGLSSTGMEFAHKFPHPDRPRTGHNDLASHRRRDGAERDRKQRGKRQDGSDGAKV